MNRSARVASDVLSRIVATKRAEIARLTPHASVFRGDAEGAGPTRGFAHALAGRGTVALIGEFKRRSPSAGPLGGEAGPAETARVYEALGASALSVLTDADYFGGSLDDLVVARGACTLPVLRKDFVIDPVQVYEARAAGADAILLIVRILDDAQLSDLREMAEGLDMDVLVEVHDRAELDRGLASGAQLLGINNRDLATFETDLSVSLRLADAVPADHTLVAESGIRTPEDVDRLGAAGFDAILVGETLMRAGVAGAASTGLANRPRSPREALR